MDQIHADEAGQSIEEYRKGKAQGMRISEQSKKYIGRPSSEWPKIFFNWDVSKNGQRHSLDATNQKDFAENYPEGFLLGHVFIENFDAKLCHYSRRNHGELWEVGCSAKLAFLIVYLSENRKISPPLVKPLDTGEVIFNGGHHRYAIAKELGLKRIPIYTKPEYKPEIDVILDVEWESM
ncbi:MAG: hypothetical protein BVN35_16290 [Proteobacteria bacterium ST_bin11]|nr:MAG: hypothetical protein BVN35_16290 [Proteobacteria bacterium ST_bin11]